MNPDWKELLCLGEELLDYQSALSQIMFFQRTISQRLNAGCEVWLARPYYPLPNDPEIANLLPSEGAPALVREAFDLRQPVMEVKGVIQALSTERKSTHVAFPIMSAQDLFSVLLVHRRAGFTISELNFLEGFCAHSAAALQVTRQVAIKNWRFDQLALVRSISKQIQNKRDLDVLCQLVTKLIQEEFGIYYVSIFTLNHSSQTLKFRASSGPADLDGKSVAFDVRLGEGIIGTVAQTGREITVPNVRNEPLFRYIESLPDTRSEVALPIKLGDDILGVLDLQSNQSEVFHEYDLMILRALTDNIAIAFEGTRLMEGLEKRASQVSAMLEISHALTSILDFEELMEEVVKTIQRHFGYPYVHIFISEMNRRKIRFEAGSGSRSQVFKELAISYDIDDPKGIITFVARTGQTLLANDISHEPLYRATNVIQINTRAELAIPLAYAGQIYGVLDLQSDVVDSFDVADIPLLEALGASIAIAIRNATLYRSEIWRRKVNESFREVAGLVSANIALDELLDRILTELEKTLPCDVSAVWLAADDGDGSPEGLRLKVAASHGIPAEAIDKALENSAARALLESAMDSTEPVIRTPEDPIGPLGLALNYPVDYSSVAAPLRAGERVLGVLAIGTEASGKYGSEAGQISLTLANNAAIAIQNNQLFAAAQEQAWVSTILLQISEAAQVNLTVDELLATMARLTPLLIGVKNCAFFLLNSQTQKFNLISQYGLDLPDSPALEFDQSLPAFQRLIETYDTVFVENPEIELELPQAALSVDRSTLVLLPLLSRNNLLGAFLVGHQVEGEFRPNTDFDQQIFSLLQGIAQQTAVALENLQLLEARQEEAYVTAVLLQVAQTVVSQNELKDIFDTIVHLMPILVGIDACAIYLWDAEEQNFQTAEVFSSLSKETFLLKNKVYTPDDFPMLQAALDQDLMVACQLSEPDFPPQRWPELDCFTPAHEFNWREARAANWVLGVPLSLKGELFGVMVAQETNVSTAFHERRLEILSGIAQQVALAIQNDRLILEEVQRERLEKEIDLARQIQRTFLPAHLPRVDGWEIDIHWQTAREVGGDFYDFFRLDKDRMGLVIGDVSDKGMPAALYMTVARTLIRAFAHGSHSPARVLKRVNRLLVGDSQDGLFVTAIYAILNTKTGVLTYANAGHNLPLIVRGNSRKVEPLPKGGMALGIIIHNDLNDMNMEINPGDSILLYTDGVTESFSPSGTAFGEERLVGALVEAPGNRVAELKKQLNHALEKFLGGDSPSDDLTLVFLHRFREGNN